MDWPFAEARRAEIAAHFAEKQREKPELWNGRVLLGRNPVFNGERFGADYFEIDFASFLAWRDWGFPDKDVFNGFGMGALRAPTAPSCSARWARTPPTPAASIFLPARPISTTSGTALDIPGSVAREVEEETGLAPHEYRAAAHWDCVSTGAAVAMMRLFDVDMPGEALRARIEANLARQSSPELSAIHLVRGASDLTAAMPRFVTAFLEAHVRPNPDGIAAPDACPARRVRSAMRLTSVRTINVIGARKHQERNAQFQGGLMPVRKAARLFVGLFAAMAARGWLLPPTPRRKRSRSA